MPDADPHPWAVRCRGGTCWSCTGASGAPWKPRTRTPGPCRPTPTPSGSSPATARPTATRSSPPAPPRPHPGLHRRPTHPRKAGHRPQPLPRPARLRQMGRGRGRPFRPAPGWHATAPLARAPVDVVPAEQLTRLLKSCEGATSPAAATPPASCCWSTPGAAGRMRRHDPGRCRSGPADGVGAGQGPPVAGAADRRRDRPGPRPLPTGARGPSAGPSGGPVGRPQRTHDPVGELPGHPRSVRAVGLPAMHPISSGLPSPPAGWPRVATRTS
jgi:hypothetical protein